MSTSGFPKGGTPPANSESRIPTPPDSARPPSASVPPPPPSSRSLISGLPAVGVSMLMAGCAAPHVSVRPAALLLPQLSPEAPSLDDDDEPSSSKNASDLPHSRHAPMVAPPFALARPEDAVVRIVTGFATCTGTLIAPDLVLTAHHCVVERGPASGGPPNHGGQFLKLPVEPATVRVEFGGDYLAWGSLGVKAVVVPPCGEAGAEGDLAILVLGRKLRGHAQLAVRLDDPPELGEVVDSSGFGRCAMSPGGIYRHEREGGKIRALAGGTFVVDASVCPGDSGGPVRIRGTNVVVGVVSLSAMDNDPNTRALSIMARVDRFRSVFARARSIGDGAEASELPPISCE